MRLARKVELIHNSGLRMISALDLDRDSLTGGNSYGEKSGFTSGGLSNCCGLYSEKRNKSNGMQKVPSLSIPDITQ